MVWTQTQDMGTALKSLDGGGLGGHCYITSLHTEDARIGGEVGTQVFDFALYLDPPNADLINV